MPSIAENLLDASNVVKGNTQTHDIISMPPTVTKLLRTGIAQGV
jgi:hypothetical protein